jgi:hypothetical protein
VLHALPIGLRNWKSGQGPKGCRVIEKEKKKHSQNNLTSVLKVRTEMGVKHGTKRTLMLHTAVKPTTVANLITPCAGDTVPHVLGDNKH